jgi:hypothetical protein
MERRSRLRGRGRHALPSSYLTEAALVKKLIAAAAAVLCASRLQRVDNGSVNEGESVS